MQEIDFGRIYWKIKGFPRAARDPSGFLTELTDLKGIEKLKGYEVLSIIEY